MECKNFEELNERIFGSEKNTPFKKKVGNPDPKGMKKGHMNEVYNLREKLAPFIPMVIQKLIDIIRDPESDNKDKIKCIEQLLNRYDGKATERVEISMPGDVSNMSASQVLNSITALMNDTNGTANKKVTIRSAIKEADKIEAIGGRRDRIRA